jgi:hypothetical protein
MASHGINWTLGAHMRFESLDFVITMEGDLVQAIVPAQSSSPTGLDAIVEALEELWLSAQEAHALALGGWSTSSPCT